MESSVYERLDLNKSWDTSTWDDRVTLRETRHQQDTAPLSSSDPLSSDSAVPLSSDQMMDSTRQNVAVLSLLLSVSLLGNLLAFSVIMFRKTRFGNGQFAVLILCLTVSDLLTVTCGLLGGLILEAGQMSWTGSSASCGFYYFLTSWFLGLAAYLVVVLVGMLHVKRSTSWLSRLQECRLLLLVLVITSLLPALPELFIRSNVTVFTSSTDTAATSSVCILSAGPALYGFYVAFKLVVRHFLPLLCVLLSVLCPRTQVAKRLSSLFLGGGATCECGPCGTELRTPHACAKMAAQCRPDVVREAVHTVLVVDKGKTVTKPTITVSVREDPHRRRYKMMMSYTFITTTSFYLLIEIIFQIQSYLTVPSYEDSINHEDNLATVLYFATYLQQIISPVIFLIAEFIIK